MCVDLAPFSGDQDPNIRFGMPNVSNNDMVTFETVVHPLINAAVIVVVEMSKDQPTPPFE